MAVEFLINRLKALVIIILGLFRRTLCCFRRRRRSSCDTISLSESGGELPIVIVNRLMNNKQEQETWDQWDENPVVVVPDNSVQSKIDQYRQQINKSSESSVEEPQINFFEDMTPKITRQKKILLRNQNIEESNINISKFAVSTDRIPTNELEVWEDNTAGWEKETVEEFGDPTHALREQKKHERERRMYEQQKKRIEYNFRPQPLGEKIVS